MEPEVVRPAEPPRRRPRCCTLSCAGCLVVLLLAGLAAAWFWTRTASPWLTERRARLVERYPWAGQIWEAGTALAGDSGGRTISPGELGSTDPADFPEDVWLPRGAETTYNVRAHGGLAAVTVSEGGVEGIVRRCRSEMSARGWAVGEAGEMHQGRVLVFEKGERRARVHVFESAGAVEVWVEVGSGG